MRGSLQFTFGVWGFCADDCCYCRKSLRYCFFPVLILNSRFYQFLDSVASMGGLSLALSTILRLSLQSLHRTPNRV